MDSVLQMFTATQVYEGSFPVVLEELERLALDNLLDIIQLKLINTHFGQIKSTYLLISFAREVFSFLGDANLWFARKVFTDSSEL